MKFKDQFRASGPLCARCGKVQSPKWKNKLCQKCFENWRQEMIAAGKWDFSRDRK